MLIKNPVGWELPEHQATDEAVFLNRRKFIAALGAGGLAAGLPITAAAAKSDDPTADLYPVQKNLRYRLDRDVTREDLAAGYNNFYEFGAHKQIQRAAQALKIRPWTVKIDGMVEKQQTVDIDRLIRSMPLEERLYRFRCVERWAMAVPWSGFPLKALVDFAKPLSGAKYIRFETFKDSKIASGQRQFWYPWPYVEGLSMAEATNELAFMATGIYGKPLAKQFGAPVRLVTPWKYGFKSIKSIVRISFTDKRPVSFWERLLAKEYGFWANVNPEVPHPRWSQAREQLLGSREWIPTKIYNGYGPYVADVYKDLKGERLFM